MIHKTTGKAVVHTVYALLLFALALGASCNAVSQSPSEETAKPTNSPGSITPLPTDEVDLGDYEKSLSVNDRLSLIDDTFRLRDVYKSRASTGLAWLRPDGQVPTVREIMGRIKEYYTQIPGLDEEMAGYMWRRIAGEYDNIALLTPKQHPAFTLYENAELKALELALFTPTGKAFRPYAYSAAFGFAAMLERLKDGEAYSGAISVRSYTWKDALEFYYAGFDIMAAYEKGHDFSQREHPLAVIKGSAEDMQKLLVRLGQEQKTESVLAVLAERYPDTKLQEQLRKLAGVRP